MAAVARRRSRHDHDVAGAGLDVAVAARAPVALHRLVGLDPADVDLGVVAGAHPRRAQSTSASAITMAAATKTRSDGRRRTLRYGLKPTADSIVRPMETIEVTRAEGGIVTVTLNRPEKKNAITGQMWDELLETFHEVAGNTGEDRVLILTGAGGAFCAGADLWAKADPDVRPRHQIFTMKRVTEVIMALHRLPQPTIAKVRGVAVGAGCNLALACDLIVAGDDARFSEIFAKRGLTLDAGGSWFLPRLIGMHRAKEMALFADILSAKEAEALGLVNRVVPAGEIDAFVDDWAARLTEGPPVALAQTKRLLNNSFQVTLEQALEDEGAAQTVNFGTKDTPEAIAAFVEKRTPTFKGL
jgi:enoyl-CoA hydratase/carnithine racemase